MKNFRIKGTSAIINYCGGSVRLFLPGRPIAPILFLSALKELAKKEIGSFQLPELEIHTREGMSGCRDIFRLVWEFRELAFPERSGEGQRHHGYVRMPVFKDRIHVSMYGLLNEETKGEILVLIRMLEMVFGEGEEISGPLLEEAEVWKPYKNFFYLEGGEEEVEASGRNYSAQEAEDLFEAGKLELPAKIGCSVVRRVIRNPSVVEGKLS